MKILSTKTHGVIDYVMGIFLIIAPWLFGFARGGAETWIMVVLGLGIIAYSLMTDYEYGAVKKISMRGHLWLDGLGGLLLAASPWLFGFAEYVFWPHLILGGAEIIAAFTTETVPTEERVHSTTHRPMQGERNAYSRNRTTHTHTTAEAQNTSINAKSNQSAQNRSNEPRNKPLTTASNQQHRNNQNPNQQNAVKNTTMSSDQNNINSQTNANNLASSANRSNQAKQANPKDQNISQNQNKDKEDHTDQPQAQNKPLNNRNLNNSQSTKPNPNKNQNQ